MVVCKSRPNPNQAKCYSNCWYISADEQQLLFIVSKLFGKFFFYTAIV